MNNELLITILSGIFLSIPTVSKSSVITDSTGNSSDYSYIIKEINADGTLNSVYNKLNINQNDLSSSSNIVWLLGISAFGLVGGALVTLSSANIEDDDNWKAPIMAIAGTILMLLCDIVLLGLIQNPTIVEFAKYNFFFKVVYYEMFANAIIFTIISLLSACVQNPEE